MAFDPHDPDQVARFSRQLLLAEVGLNGQARIGDARVVVVGAGGLAAPVLAYLAAAGVGTLVVLDGDTVEASNLHRQVLFATPDVGLPKPLAARPRLEALGPYTAVSSVCVPLTPANAVLILEGSTVVIDATDNFPVRYLLNDTCRLLGIPLVHGGLTRFGGVVSTFAPGGPCYRCFFPEPPRHGRIPGCGEAGVLGPAVGVIGNLQALEALKWIVGERHSNLVGTLLTCDLWAPSFERLKLARDPDCPLCGEAPTLTALDPTNPLYAPPE